MAFLCEQGCGAMYCVLVVTVGGGRDPRRGAWCGRQAAPQSRQPFPQQEETVVKDKGGPENSCHFEQR